VSIGRRIAVVVAALATAPQGSLLGVQGLLQELEAVLVAQQAAGVHGLALGGNSQGLGPA